MTNFSRFDGVFLALRGLGVINVSQGLRQILLAVLNLLAGTPFSWEYTLFVTLTNLALATAFFVFADSFAALVVRRSKGSDLAISLGICSTMIIAIWLPQLVEDWIRHQQGLRLDLGPSIAYSLSPAMLGIAVLFFLTMPLLNWNDWKRRLDPHD